MSTLSTTTSVPTRLGRLTVRSVGQGPAAVLWHSMFVDSRSFDRVVPALSRARQLVLVDGPGWGASEPLTRRVTMAECALAAEDLLDGLADRDVLPVGPVDWVGNAWGGHVGYRLAGTRPERLRTLVTASAPTSPLPERRRQVLGLLSHVVERFGVVGALRTAVLRAQLTDRARRLDLDAVALLGACLDEADRASVANTLRSFVVGRIDLSGELARSLVPALVLVGDDRGDLTPDQAREMAAVCRDARVVVLDGARTLLPVERPGAFAGAVLEFWERHPPLG